jgi:hypothetical protein
MSSDSEDTEEQAFIATLKLGSGDMGTPEERQRISALEEQISAAIDEADAGEFDGNEYGGGACTLYMYGPSAEQLFTIVFPILKTFRPAAGSYVVKRYGKPGAQKERIALSGE